MDDGTRGRIRNPERAAQLRDFSGLRYGKITPTDVDGLLEFGDRLFVIMEFKCTGAPMDFGQKLCFERVVNALAQSRKKAVAIVAEHNTPIGQQIDCAKAIVREFYEGGTWIPRRSNGGDVTVSEFINFYHQTYVQRP